MADALIFLALPILQFIAISFALATSLILLGVLTAAFAGLLMTGSPKVKAALEFMVVATGVAIAACELPGQAMMAGLFIWIYLELLRSDVKQQNLALIDQK